MKSSKHMNKWLVNYERLKSCIVRGEGEVWIRISSAFKQ